MTPLTRPSVPRARRGYSPRIWVVRIAGLLLLIAWVAALAVWTPDGKRIGTVAIATPKPDARIEGQAGSAVPMQGRARRRSGCLVGPPAQRIPIRKGHFGGTFPLPQTIGRQLLWLDVECQGKRREHYARLVQVNTASKAKRAEILRVHMSSQALHRWINRVFPPLLNKHIANYLEQKTREKQKGLLELTQGASEHAALSLTAAARVYPRSSRTVLFLKPDPDYLLRHIAFEPVSVSDTALEPRVHHRYAAFGNFVQDQLGRVGGWVEGEPLMDTAAVQKLLANFRPVPVRFETLGLRVEAFEMRGDFDNQVIVLRGRTQLK